MKKTKILLTLAVAASSLVCGARNVPSLNVSDLNVERVSDRLEISMKVHPSAFKLKTNTQWVMTPVIRSTTSPDSVLLSPIMVTGKNAYYYAERNGLDKEMPLLRAGKGEAVEYADATPFRPWMNNSVVIIRAAKVSCCGESPSDTVKDTDVALLNFVPPVFEPEFQYVFDVKAEIKERKLSGRADVSFMVNKTNIDPNYMNNQRELRKILNSIDSVRANKDATVDTIRLTGYASPEGTYAGNARLAQGRTEALKAYVQSLYDFPAKVYFANSVPEDWGGLREYVAKSTLDDRDAVLALIDDASIPVEKKNDVLKAKFPKTYAYLLKNVYPGLRHTDYYIHYVIRQFTTVEEIAAAYERDPRNLSLNEFYMLAKSLQPGTDKYNEVIERALSFNQDVTEANLNAANVALQAGELDRAERYLKKAGASPQAEYSRGLLDALRKNYDSAASRFRTARNGGVDKAKKALDNIDRIKKAAQQVKYLGNE